MKLDAYLKSRGETEVQFAKRAGIGHATVSRAKKGDARSIAVLRKIVVACGGAVSIEDLLPADVMPTAKPRRKRSAA